MDIETELVSGLPGSLLTAVVVVALVFVRQRREAYKARQSVSQLHQALQRFDPEGHKTGAGPTVRVDEAPDPSRPGD